MELLFTSSYFRQVIVNNLILDGFTLYYQIDIQNLDAHRKGSAAVATRATGQKHLKPEKAYTKLASSVMLIYCTATITQSTRVSAKWLICMLYGTNQITCTVVSCLCLYLLPGK